MGETHKRARKSSVGLSSSCGRLSANDLAHDLLQAVHKADLDAVKECLAQGASPDGVRNAPTATPLGLACEIGLTKIAQCLIDLGASVNKEDGRPTSKGTTPLTHASKNGRVDIVRMLLGSGARVGGIALCHACYFGHAKVALLLLDRGKECLIYQTDSLHPLIGACFWGLYKVAEQLVERGAKIDHQDQDHTTPLMMAADKGHEELVKLLLSRGARVNATNSLGQTALSLACQQYGNEKVVVQLLQGGALVCSMDRSGYSPLDCCAYWGRDSMAQEMLETACRRVGTESPQPIANQDDVTHQDKWIDQSNLRTRSAPPNCGVAIGELGLGTAYSQLPEGMLEVHQEKKIYTLSRLAHKAIMVAFRRKNLAVVAAIQDTAHKYGLSIKVNFPSLVQRSSKKTNNGFKFSSTAGPTKGESLICVETNTAVSIRN